MSGDRLKRSGVREMRGGLFLASRLRLHGLDPVAAAGNRVVVGVNAGRPGVPRFCFACSCLARSCLERVGHEGAGADRPFFLDDRAVGGVAYKLAVTDEAE